TAFDFSTEHDNGYYNVIPFVGTPDELLASIADETNWVLSDTALTVPTTWDFTLEEDVNPVELASFTVTISAQNYITLTWVTQTETGMQGYYIFRDSDSNLAGAQMVSPLIPSANSSQMQTYVFEDTDVFETGTYYYWLQANDMDGTVGFHGPVSVFYNATGDNPTPEIPLVTELKSVYPNPFNPTAFIPFSLAQDCEVSFKIYNTRGQIVKHYELGNKAAGNYRITWDGTDYLGKALSNGVYQIVMTAGDQVYQTKTTLLK
ncbi:MAG: FlgD immunoglobulin-like domain containing protein, partial [Candidatus Cloacimonadaceae bacterium]